jgi:glycosyltransferase involved in cell wall biosynthesis
MITYVFRKKSATVFSIEKLFDQLFLHLRESGEDIGRIELPRISTGLLSVLRNVWFVARQRNKGILHITGDVHYAALLCPFSQMIVTVHDCVVLQRGAGIKGAIMRLLWFSLPLRMASAVTVISERTKCEVLETVAIPEKKITVIPNFIDPGFEFTERPFRGDAPRILHVGTTPNKNLPNVVAALRGISCVLVIVGRVPSSVVRDLEEAGVAYETHIGIDHSAMRNLYVGADIVSFPSFYEGFGMPILEGQAVGRPVLSSNLEPMRGVAGVGGALLVDPHSVEAIRAGFLALLGGEQLRARLIAAGRENCKRFTLDAVAARYRALYREIDRRRSPARDIVL